MKHFVFVCVAGGWLCWSACINHSQPPVSHPQDSLSNQDSARNTFFPIADYLETEILHVNSTPLAMRKYFTANGRMDSSFIQLPEFNALALQFLSPELKDGRFERKYTETAFLDKATHLATFTYSTTDKDLSLQRADVLATPKNGVNQVKSIYLEKSRVSGDSVIQQKMFWQSGKSFQVVSLIRISGSKPIEQRLMVVWDKGEDNE